MAISAETLPPDRAGSPSSLIVTFAGSHLREIGGWIPVAHLITVLGAAGIGSPAVRQALVRLKSRGFVASERRSGQAGYALTPTGVDDLEIGDRRIYRYGEADEAAGWVLAVFSVPEHARQHRHRLRSQLSWLGFGTVSPGVWIAPASLAAPARALVAADGLAGYVTWFTAQHLSRPEVAAWWDLDSLRATYTTFLSEWEPAAVLRVDDAKTSFARHLRMIDAWRLFPRLDPGLPAPLLPADWPGRQAWQVFSDLHDRWFPAAADYVRSVIAAGAPSA